MSMTSTRSSSTTISSLRAPRRQRLAPQQSTGSLACERRSDAHMSDRRSSGERKQFSSKIDVAHDLVTVLRSHDDPALLNYLSSPSPYRREACRLRLFHEHRSFEIYPLPASGARC